MVWTVRVVVVCVVELPVNDGTPSGAPGTLPDVEEGGWTGADVPPDAEAGGGTGWGGGGGGGGVETVRDFEVGLSKSTEKGVFTPGAGPVDPDRSGTIARLR